MLGDLDFLADAIAAGDWVVGEQSDQPPLCASEHVGPDLLGRRAGPETEFHHELGVGGMRRLEAPEKRRKRGASVCFGANKSRIVDGDFQRRSACLRRITQAEEDQQDQRKRDRQERQQ